MAIYELDGQKPELPSDGRYWVAETATVIGRVRLMTDASIWFGSVLRGDNEPIVVGAGSNIQEGVMIHTDPRYPVRIGEGCTIGHHAIIHGCIIGENSLVGMGATILNGARIGRNCLIGANALITEGKKFPDNSLIVGSPAKVIRTLDDEAVEKLKQSALRYIENWKRFARDLRQL